MYREFFTPRECVFRVSQVALELQLRLLKSPNSSDSSTSVSSSTLQYHAAPSQSFLQHEWVFFMDSLHWSSLQIIPTKRHIMQGQLHGGSTSSLLNCCVGCFNNRWYLRLYDKSQPRSASRSIPYGRRLTECGANPDVGLWRPMLVKAPLCTAAPIYACNPSFFDRPNTEICSTHRRSLKQLIIMLTGKADIRRKRILAEPNRVLRSPRRSNYDCGISRTDDCGISRTDEWMR